ncbi:MAG: LacI family DNA-binding transcriptional regulator [Candidatus Limnocylindria bacterium]
MSVYDVARRAGVSAATASRVLSGSPYPVRPTTRERVLVAAAELEFRPNMLARALVTARTHTIGAIVHDISDPYFGEIVRGLEDAARLRGYQVFVCSSDRDAARELEYVQSLLDRRVDGVVFAGGGIEDRAYKADLRRLLDAFRGRGGTVVRLSPHSYRTPSVQPDNRGGAKAMTRHLLALGHRLIAFIGGPPQLTTSAVRYAGHEEALEEAGMRPAPELNEPGGFTIAGGAKAMATLLDRCPELTAVFAANDMMAFGALHELQRRGATVPDDVSVAGFDDIYIAAHAHPPLTTVRVPMYEMGRQGAVLALDLLDGRRARSLRLPTVVVERASVGPPRGQRGAKGVPKPQRKVDKEALRE